MLSSNCIKTTSPKPQRRPPAEGCLCGAQRLQLGKMLVPVLRPVSREAAQGMGPAASPRAGGLMEEAEKGVQAHVSDTRAPLLPLARPAGLH